MKTTLTIQQKLAVAAVTLGFVAMFGPDPYARSYAKVDTAALAKRADSGADRLSVEAVADLLVQGTHDVQIIDLRPEADYAQGAIPQAVNLRVGDLLADADLKTADLLVYSAGDLAAAQAWVLARAAGFRSIRVIGGGYEAWKRDVLYPEIATGPTAVDAAAGEKKKVLSLHFGGAPRIAGAAVALAPSPGTPKPAVKAAPPPAAGGAKPKKKREGC